MQDTVVDQGYRSCRRRQRNASSTTLAMPRDLPAGFSTTMSDTWNQQLAPLKARYKHIREPVLVALNILMHDRNIALEDAKAQANLHGVRITAASINAARTFLSRMDVPAAATLTAKNEPSAPSRRARRARSSKSVDAEVIIRGFVANLRGQGNAEAERLREGIRKAIAVLQAAVGS